MIVGLYKYGHSVKVLSRDSNASGLIRFKLDYI